MWVKIYPLQGELSFGVTMGKITELHYMVQDFDRLLTYATRNGLVEMPGREVYEKTVPTYGGRLAVAASFVAGYIAGVGVLWDGGKMLRVIGTRPGLDFFDWRASYRPYGPTMEEGLECLEMPDTRDTRVHRVREERINLHGIRKRVAAAYPQLLAPDAPREELRLLPSCGDLHLGGRLFGREHYLYRKHIELLRK